MMVVRVMMMMVMVTNLDSQSTHVMLPTQSGLEMILTHHWVT